MTLLVTLISVIFALLLPCGTNVPYYNKPRIVKSLLILNLGFHIITQIVQLIDGSVLSNPEVFINPDKSNLKAYYDIVALTPSKVHDDSWRWIQFITANFVHGGWFHIITNLWFFTLFAINLEDVFGPKRFLAFIAASCIGSYLCVAVSTEGTKAYDQPHLGFSGVVYAAMAAYLVCFPRSKIRVILIYDIGFWILVLFSVTFVSIIGEVFIPGAGQLLWIIGFVGLFLAIQPSNHSFGLPAFVFLGYRVIQDAVSLESQIDESQVSVWAHGGGFMVGVIAGILVKGFKGLEETWETEVDMTSTSRREALKQQAQVMQEAGETDVHAARQYLGQRVFVGDALAATEYYINTVMSKYPNMVLDLRDHMALARILNFQGRPVACLHAYERLLWQEPDTPGVEEAYLEAARLTVDFPDRIPDGLRYLNKFESFTHVLMRDKMESRRIREDLLRKAASAGVDVTAARDELFEGNPDRRRERLPVSEGPPRRWTAHEQEEVSDSRIPVKSTRMQQLQIETASQIPGAEVTGDSDRRGGGPPPIPQEELIRANQTNTDKEEQERLARMLRRKALAEPVKLMFQDNVAEAPSAAGKDKAAKSSVAGDDKPQAGNEVSDVLPASPVIQAQSPTSQQDAPLPDTNVSSNEEKPAKADVYGVAADPTFLNEYRRSRRREEPVIELPKVPDKSVPPKSKPFPEDIKAKAPLPRTPSAKNEQRLESHLYEDSPLAGDRDSVRFSAEMPLRLVTAGTARKTSDDEFHYAVLLQPGVSVPPDRLISIMRQFYGREEEAQRALIEGKGLLGWKLELEKARVLSSMLSVQGVPVTIRDENHPALTAEPREATALEIENGDVAIKMPMGRVRLRVEDIVVLNYCQMRLSTNSKSQRRCLEFVAKPEFHRIHMWEKTINAQACRFNGDTIPQDDPLLEIFLRLTSLVPQSALTLASRRAQKTPNELASFQNYQIYENYITYCVLSVVGETIEGNQY